MNFIMSVILVLGLMETAPQRTRASNLSPSVVDTLAQVLISSQPPYTPEAFEKSIEGTVTLEMAVDSKGAAKVLGTLKGIGYGLDENAENLVVTWKFSPALRSGVAVDSVVQLDVEFKLAKAGIRIDAPGITAPSVVKRVQPEFTPQGRAARATGTVKLEAVVHQDGTVQVARVLQELGYGLTENAIQAVEQWTFNPGTKDGKPLPILTNIDVNFDWR